MDAHAATAAAPSPGMKLCSSCGLMQPEALYSSAQLKRKGKRRCVPCVSGEGQGQDAAAEPAEGNALPPPQLGDHRPYYQGARKGGVPDGVGRLLAKLPRAAGGDLEEICLFDGEWSRGLKAWGNEIDPETRDMYNGLFDDQGRRSSGALTYAKDGSVYRGQFAEGGREGLGIFVHGTTGEVHDGQWAGDERSGLGAVWSKEGKLIHLGQWEGDETYEEQPVPASCLYEKHGWPAQARERASLFYPCGGWYEGVLDRFDKCPEGKGQRFNKDGSVREGGTYHRGMLQSAEYFTRRTERRGAAVDAQDAEQVDPARAGFVHLRDAAGQELRWEGEMFNGKPHGRGTVVYNHRQQRRTEEDGAGDATAATAAVAADSTAAATPASPSTGTASVAPADVASSSTAASSSSPHPHSQQPSSSFRSYTGRKVAGSRLGTGRMSYASGARYDGGWRDDRAGLGALVHADGALFCGSWSAGRASGPGVRWDAGGTRTGCGWFEGETLVQSMPVARAVVTDDRFLSEQERGASLLYPDGSYFVGHLPSLLAPRLLGTLYDAQHRVVHRGAFAPQMQLNPIK